MPSRLFFLDLAEGRVLSANPDGSDRKIVATGCRLPDGIAVDVDAGHLYWTNMGVPSRNDGSIERADLDGRNRTTIVPEGVTSRRSSSSSTSVAASSTGRTAKACA